MAEQHRHLTTEQLSAFLDGQLSNEEKEFVAAHVKTCEQCQQELAELRQTVALLRALPQPALPRSFVLPESTVLAPVASHLTPLVPAPRSVRQSRRAWPGYVSNTVRVISTLAAILGLFLLLSSLNPMGHPTGGMATSTNSTSSSNLPRAAQTRATPGITSSPKSTATPTTSSGGAVPNGTSKDVTPTQAATATPGEELRPTTNSEPVPPPWDRSTTTGRALWGTGLLVLAVIGFLLLVTQRRQQRG